ncbi:unnamed protein product [Prorocentrum cordatum]|uniref:Methyltransferase FkbM domain-containing protein n=1 Tax=Prorocentrum cordatum TaxID=2364126 RepID=A0ABN9TK00_9DINO|nr:unnamed protein product [Polarella glacialis]CAK0846295.1 unnamed protein product [Polarella glacialis]
MARRVVLAVAVLLGCGMLMSAFVPFSPMAIRPADQQPAALGTAMTPDDRIVLPSGCCILHCDSNVAIAEGQNCSSSNNQSLNMLSYTLHGSNAHRVAGWSIKEWLKFIGSLGVGAKFVFQVGSFGAFLDEVLPLLKGMDPHQAQQWQGVTAEARRCNVDKLKEAYVEQLSAGTLRIIHTAVTDVCHASTLKFVVPSPAFSGGNEKFKWKFGTGTIKDSENGQKMQTWGEGQLEELEVPCGTTDYVMRFGNVPESPEFVQVDAESHDAHILTGIDFTKFSPKLIRWESLPNMEKKDILLDKLYSHGYVTIKTDVGADPSAVRPDVLFAAVGMTV